MRSKRGRIERTVRHVRALASSFAEDARGLGELGEGSSEDSGMVPKALLSLSEHMVERSCILSLATQHDSLLKAEMPEIIPERPQACGEGGVGDDDTQLDERDVKLVLDMLEDAAEEDAEEDAEDGPGEAAEDGSSRDPSSPDPAHPATPEPLSCETLTGLLERSFGVEDQLKLKSESSKVIHRRLQDIREELRRRHFSLTGAKRACKKLNDRPRDEALKGCMVQYVNKGTTKKRHYVFGRHAVSLSLAPAEAEALRGAISDRLRVEARLLVVDELVRHVPSPLKRLVENVKRRIEGEYEATKAITKRTGFSWTHTMAKCTKECQDDTLQASVKVLHRISAEVTEAARKVDGDCKEADGLYCAEGMSPQQRRGGLNRINYAKYYAVMLLLYKPVVTPLAFTIGFLAGGPTTGYIAAGAAAMPPMGFIVPIPMAALVATDMFKSCRCFMRKCKYSAPLDQCIMLPHKTRNPYGYLPYMGQKCVPVPLEEGAGGRRKCEIRACERGDYLGAVRGAGVPAYGTIGSVRTAAKEPAALYNCISTSNARSGFVHGTLVADQLPLGSGVLVDNTIQNRTAFYRSLGVEERVGASAGSSDFST